VELQEQGLAFVEEWQSHRSAPARFPVSVKFVDDMVILRRATGGLQPRRQGNGDEHGKLEVVRKWLEARMARQGDLTLDDLVVELADHHGIAIHRTQLVPTLQPGCLIIIDNLAAQQGPTAVASMKAASVLFRRSEVLSDPKRCSPNP